MNTKCCRSLPRCSTCPVVLAARARGRFARSEDALVNEVLGGLAPRELPSCVHDALVALDERRRPDVLLPRV